MTPDRPDVFSWLLEDYNSKRTSYQDKLNLDGDAYTIAVAGRYIADHRWVGLKSNIMQ